MEIVLGLAIIAILILLIQISNRVSSLCSKTFVSDRKLNLLYEIIKDLKEQIASMEQKLKTGTITPAPPYDPTIKVEPVPTKEPTTVEAVDIPVAVATPPIIEKPIVEPVAVEPIAVEATSPEIESSINEPVIAENTERESIKEEVVTTTTPPPYIAPKADRVASPKIEVSVVNTARTINQDDLVTDKLFTKLKDINWLNAIGVITLVLGLGFFVKYAIDQEWINEIGRVALGLAIGGVIIGIAHKLSTKYHVFSSVLMGGGFATLYTTITLAFREYAIFSQTTAFIILIVITLLAILLSIAYKRQELAIFAFIGGMLSPLLVSTGAGNHVVLFSYIFLLNTAVLIVAIRQKWLVIDKFSYVLTFLYMLAWLSNKYQIQYQLDAIVFNTLFYLQFMTLLSLRYLSLSKEKSSVSHLLYIVLTNFTSLLCFFIIHLNSSGTNYFGVIIIGMALIDALFIVLVTRNKTAPIDKNFTYTLLALTIGLVSLAIPVQLSKVYITIVWAVEMSVLLWIWTRTKANLFRIGAMILAVLTIVSYTMDVAYFSPIFDYINENETSVVVNLVPIILNQYTITGIVVMLALLFSKYTLTKYPVKEEDTFGIKDIQQPTCQELQKVFSILSIVMLFLVPFLEIAFQVNARIDGDATIKIYRNFSLYTYTTLFAVGYLLLYKNKISQRMYGLHTILATLLALFFLFFTNSLSTNIIVYQSYSRIMFAPHLLSFAALIYYCYWFYKNKNSTPISLTKVMYPLLFGILVLIFSAELDNILSWALTTRENYYEVRSNIHSYGYPILWGLMAMVLMLFGIKTNQAELRKLSLISYGIIILKFYLYDVWRMTQAGKIASFVALGVILLIVSFLLERIKLLLKEKANEETDMKQE